MSEILQEDAVAEFSRLTQQFLSLSVNPRLLLDVMASFYRNVRISGTTIETDGDMLLLQWGTAKPNLISSFTDFRHLSDRDIIFDTHEFQYFSLTRQIFTFDDDNEAEFDDEAIALCIELFFGEKSGVELSSNMWISSPNELDTGLNKFLQNPFIKTLIDSVPSKVNASVTHAG